MYLSLTVGCRMRLHASAATHTPNRDASRGVTPPERRLLSANLQLKEPPPNRSDFHISTRAGSENKRRNAGRVFPPVVTDPFQVKNIHLLFILFADAEVGTCSTAIMEADRKQSPAQHI